MIRETGTVVAIESDCLWVETLQKSTCGSCAARQGCGQRLLATLTGHSNHIRVLPGEVELADLSLGQRVTIGVPERVLVSGAALVYLLPVAGLVAGASFIHGRGGTELAAIVAGFVGLLLGALVVRWQSWRSRHDTRYCPVLLEFDSTL